MWGIFLDSSYILNNPSLLVYVLTHGHGVTSFSTRLVSLAPGWCLLNSPYTLYLCSVFLLEIALLNLWLKQLYSSTNKNNTYRRTSHVSSPLGNVNFLFLNLLSDIWGWQHLYRILNKKNCAKLSNPEEGAILFVVHSLCNGKVQGLSYILSVRLGPIR